MPLDIAWTHLWWSEGSEMAALGYTNGAAVSSWPDEIGTADLGAGAASSPTYTAASAAFENLPAVDFTTGQDLITGAFTAIPPPWEIVAVYRQKAIITFTQKANFRASEVAIGQGGGGAPVHRFERNAWGGLDVGAMSTVGSVVRATSAAGASISYTFTRNTTVAGPSALGPTFNMTSLRVNDTTFFGDGRASLEVVLIGIKSSAMTSTEWEDFRDWATDRYLTPTTTRGLVIGSMTLN